MPSVRCYGHVRMRLKVHTALLPTNEANLPRTSRPVNRSHNPAVNRDRWRRYGAFAASIAEHARHSASYNPLSERTIQNPYPVYARLRRHSPVHRSVILGSWIPSRYDDVLAVARDHERFSNDPRWRNTTASVLPPAPDDYSILLVDPPEHTRLRKVAARAFTRPRLMTLEPTIEAFANNIVERAVERGEVEWIGDPRTARPSSIGKVSGCSSTAFGRLIDIHAGYTGPHRFWYFPPARAVPGPRSSSA